MKKKHAAKESLTAEELKNHFQEVFGTETEHVENHADFNHDNHNVSDDELNGNFTYEELRKAVFSQKNNKSPGTDNLPSEILKASFDHISNFLLSLYNKMFSTGEYPVSWGEGIITPIFKKGNIDDAGNYRGITLIKIYSQLLLNRLTNWSEKYEKLSKNQFGFQKGKSVVDCVFILHSIITKVLNAGEKLYCVFIDYEKCFDKIDRTFLWQKLISENVSSKLVTAIKSMYTTVKSCIRFKSTYSSFFNSYAGLKQGDPSSPLLFMLFVNDIIDNINADLGNIFTLNQMKLFLILYADDQVVFAKSPETLQSLLTDIETYCNIWGLKINTAKTKMMIFERSRDATYADCFINNTRIEVIESCKYLGVTLFKNGNWNRSQKCIAKHDSFTLYNLFTVFNNIELSVNQKCKLFDSLVGSILNFGSEIWGMHGATDVEQIHTKFLRRILGVRTSTNLAALYGELGRIPLAVTRKVNMIKYWIKILQQNDTSIIKLTYLMLKDDADRNNSYRGTNWAWQIKNILEQHGLGYVWRSQNELQIPFLTIKQRIIDTYKQKWYTEINNSSRLEAYARFKHNFETEKYLNCISENKYKLALTRLRTSSHNLSIETGRYDDSDRETRICKSCNMNVVEDEYHFTLVCPHYRMLRQKFLKDYYCHWPTMQKFESLLSSSSKRQLIV